MRCYCETSIYRGGGAQMWFCTRLSVLKPEQAMIFYGTSDENSRQNVEAVMDKIKSNTKMVLKFVEANPFPLEDCIEKMRHRAYGR